MTQLPPPELPSLGPEGSCKDLDVGPAPQPHTYLPARAVLGSVGTAGRGGFAVPEGSHKPGTSPQNGAQSVMLVTA